MLRGYVRMLRVYVGMMVSVKGLCWYNVVKGYFRECMLRVYVRMAVDVKGLCQGYGWLRI